MKNNNLYRLSLLLSLGLLLTGVSAWAQAAGLSAADRCASCEISIPRFDGGISVGARGLYTAAHVNQTEFAFTAGRHGSADVYRTHNVDNDFDWGYQLALGLQVAGTGNDFLVSWTDLAWRDSESRVRQGAGGSDTLAAYAPSTSSLFSTSSTPVLPTAIESEQVFAQSETELQKIDVEFAQSIKVGQDSVYLRFHAGARYAMLDTTFTFQYYPEDTFLVTDMYGELLAESDFSGLGPRLGVDADWTVGRGFALTAGASLALLAGDVRIKEHNWVEGEETPSALLGAVYMEIGDRQARVTHDHRIVPVLEGYLGVAYHHHLSNQSHVVFESGYQVSHYFDVDSKFSRSGTDIGYGGWYSQITATL